MFRPFAAFRSSAAVCLLLAPTAPSLADTPAHWLQIKTDHFTVVTDSGDRQARHTAGQLERMHAVFAKLLPHTTDDPGSRIVVLALKDRKGFQAVEPAAYLNKGALDLAGLFFSDQDRSYILLRLDASDENHPYTTVYHEYTHYMVRHADIPVWFNEGLAQFYQNTAIFDKEVHLGQPDGNELQYLRQQKLMPLETLFSVDHNSPYYHEQNKGSVFYGESWALTHFLFLADFGKKDSRLIIYAQYLARGESSLGAAQHAFGDLKLLQSQLESYIGHGDYGALTMPFQSGVDEKSLDVQPLPTPDADAVRADVLARAGRNAEAEKLAEAVLAAAPESAVAHESMGWIKMREGDMNAARKWYSEAVALHSTSYLTYYYAGSLTMRDGNPADDNSTAADLHKAIELNPHFAPALDDLAQFDRMRNRDLDEALQMSLRAVSLDPANLNYRLNAAEIRMQRREIPAAVAVLKTTSRYAHTDEERARVKDRLEQVEKYQAQVEQAKAALAGSSTQANTSEVAMNTAAAGRNPGGPSSGQAPDTFTDTKGHLLHAEALKEPDHKLPDGPPSGPKHTVTGTLHNVGCFYPKGMMLEVDGSGKPVSLYSNDMYAIAYTAGNFTPAKELNPCRQDFDGLKARITYAGVDDPTMAGQIIAMELNK